MSQMPGLRQLVESADDRALLAVHGDLRQILRVAPNGTQPRLTITALPSSSRSGVSTCTPATLSWLMLSSRNWCVGS